MSKLLAIDLNQSLMLNENQPVSDVFSTPADLVNTLLPNIIVAAGLLLFFFIVGAGFQMVRNPDSKKATESGQKAITSALLGFVLLIGAYWIIQIVQVITGVTIL